MDYESNWEQYNLTDTKEEFIALMDILEIHNENIGSLLSAIFNREKFFCGLRMTTNDNSYFFDQLESSYQFFSSLEELIEEIRQDYIYSTRMSPDTFHDEDDFFYGDLSDESIKKYIDEFEEVCYTKHGLVRIIC